jgi:hypothetical protein
VAARLAAAVPANSTYTFSVYAQYPGYVVPQTPIQTGTTDLTENEQPQVNQTSCTAPGYQLSGT